MRAFEHVARGSRSKKSYITATQKTHDVVFCKLAKYPNEGVHRNDDSNSFRTGPDLKPFA